MAAVGDQDFVYFEDEPCFNVNVSHDELRELFGVKFGDDTVAKIADCFYGLASTERMIRDEISHFCFNFYD